MGVPEAAARLRAALQTVPGVRHYEQMAGSVDPPATVLPPPSLTWGGPEPDPTDAAWVVALVVARSDRTVEQLLALLPSVVEALDGLDDVVVRSAQPGQYPAGGVELPAYLINVEVAL